MRLGKQGITVGVSRRQTCTHRPTTDSRTVSSNHPHSSQSARSLHGVQRVHLVFFSEETAATAIRPNHSVIICTASQSLLKAVERRSPVAYHLRSLLNAQPGTTTFLWVQGHKGIPCNELADTAAKTAATTTGDPLRLISYASARSTTSKFTDDRVVWRVLLV